MRSRRRLPVLRCLGVVFLVAAGSIAAVGPASAQVAPAASVVSTDALPSSGSVALRGEPATPEPVTPEAASQPAAHHAPAAPGDIPPAASSALPWLAIPVDVLVLALLIGRRRALARARQQSAVTA